MSDHVPEHAASWDPEQFAELVGGPTWAQRVAYVRKAIVNVLGLLGTLLTLNLLPDPYDKWVSGAVALLTAVLHYWVSNGDAPGVKDNTAWAAAAKPPASDRTANTEDVE